MPMWWGKNQAGMRAETELDGEERRKAQDWWLRGMELMVAHHAEGERLGIHKQLVNRVVEPWMYITVILSATDYTNWFHLRCHPAAQPEIRWVADAMKALYDLSVPAGLPVGAWHRPLIRPEDELEIQGEELLNKVSAARCARVSYLTHDGRRDYAEDVRLYEKLVTSGHWSPLEHVAQALASDERIGNFSGWRQLRKTYAHEAGPQ
jgi:thymidylate synthase ThyX